MNRAEPSKNKIVDHVPGAGFEWRHVGPTLTRVGRLARKELVEILSDRRTILTLVLMPLLLYPLLSFAFRQFFMAFVPTVEPNREYRIGVVTTGAKTTIEQQLRYGADVEPWRVAGFVGLGPTPLSVGPAVGATGFVYFGPWEEWDARKQKSGKLHVAIRSLHEPFVTLPIRDPSGFEPGTHPPLVISVVERARLFDELRDGKVDVVVEVFQTGAKEDPEIWYKKGGPPRFILKDWNITYIEQLPRSRDVATYLEERCALANARKVQAALDRNGIPQLAVPVRTRRISFAADFSGPGLSLSALVPLVLILMTITGAVYPAIDLTAGERERGTLEILVAAPVPRLALLFAKYLAVVAVAVLTATTNLAMMLITLELTGLTQQVFRESGVTLQLVLQLFFLLVLFAAFFSALLLALTSFARSFKEAQAYLVPLMLVSLGPGVIGMLPGLQLRGILTVIPLVNIVLLARDLADGTASLGIGLIVVGSTLVYALASITAAARVFGAEAVLFSEQSGWSDLFRRPTAWRPTATLPGALLCLAMLFPVYFVIASVIGHLPQRLQLPYQVTGTVLMFSGLPLAVSLWARIRLASSFQVAPPPWTAWPAALLLAFAAAPAIYQLGILLNNWGLAFITKEMLDQLGRVRPGRVSSSWQVTMAATVAGIGILEELFFRGFLFSSLRAHAGKAATILGSAALFAAFHGVSHFDRFLPSFLMGVLLGWVCWQTRSVLPGMLLHASYNAAMYTFLTFEGSSLLFSQAFPKMPPWWQIAAFPAAAAGVALLWKARPVDKPGPMAAASGQQNGGALRDSEDAAHDESMLQN